MAERNASGSDVERVLARVFGLSAALFLLIGSGSAVAQALVFPSVETNFWPLFVLWVITAAFYVAGTFMLVKADEPTFLGIFLMVSALTGVALVGTTAAYVLTARKGVSGLEYLALGAYAFFLVVVVLVALTELSRR
jgi:FtsH-binding integral membrane protein